MTSHTEQVPCGMPRLELPGAGAGACLPFWLLLLLWSALVARSARAATYYSAYGSSRTENLTVAPGAHTFEVDNIAWYRLTQWYVNGQWQGADQDDNSGFFAIDPDFTWSFTSGFTEIKALVYDNGTFLESHGWNVTVNRPPSAPGLISASQVTADSAGVSWVASSDPDGDPVTYEVEYGKDNTIGWSSAGSPSAAAITLTGLAADTGYGVRVRARDNRGGVSDWSRNPSDPTFRTLPARGIAIARWVLSGGAPGGGQAVKQGQVVTLQAEVNGFSTGDQFAFSIYEVDTITFDDLVTPQPLIGEVQVRDGRQFVEVQWAARWRDDGPGGGDPEYRFEVVHGGFLRDSGDSASQVLTVRCQSAWHALGRLADRVVTPGTGQVSVRFDSGDIPPGARLAQAAVLWEANLGAYPDSQLSLNVFGPGWEKPSAVALGAGNRQGVVVFEQCDFAAGQSAGQGDWGVRVEGLEAARGSITFRQLEIFVTHYQPALATFNDLEGRATGNDEVFVLIHGWNPNGLMFPDQYNGPWVALFGRLREAADRSGRWDVVRYDWTQDATTGDINLADAPANAVASRDAGVAHSLHLGQALVARYPGLKKVHLIAHSAGNWVARGAAKYLRGRFPNAAIQVTSTDPFLPHSEGAAGVADLIFQVNVPDTRRIFGEMGRAPWRPARLDAYAVVDYLTDLSLGFTSAELSGYGWDRSVLLDAADEGRGPSNAPAYDPGTMNEHAGPLAWYRVTVERQLAGDAASVEGLGFPSSLYAEEPLPRIVSLSPDRAQPPGDQIALVGEATANVSAWEWSSDVDGWLSDQRAPTLDSYTMSVGLHFVSLRVQGEDGYWSMPVTTVLEVLDAPPVATLTGVLAEVTPGALLNLELGGRDQDERGGTLVSGRLALPDGQRVTLTPPFAYRLEAPHALGSYAISWTVSDNEGTMSAPVQAQFRVVESPPTPPRFDASGLGVDPSGAFRMRLVGAPGTTVEVFASSTLRDWALVGAVTLEADGSGVFVERFEPAASQRFYRLRVP